MRIISGKYGGLRFNEKLPKGVRPTTDMSKEIIYNVISNYIDFNNIHVLDLFAGSGLLGFEAISRGAKKLVSLEKNPKVVEYVKNNALKLNNEEIKVIKTDALRFIAKQEEIFDLVLADPPYDMKSINDIVYFLEGKALKQYGILVAEFSESEVILPSSRFETLFEKKLGATKLMILRKN
jgi:16S rRNA (guanine(966)-N(2))-methyltransferase RsmD